MGEQMKNNGVFIALYDYESLKLYLKNGIYGFLMSPTEGEISSRSNHYKVLSDYGCLREGTHVFFFLKRTIIYGGQIIGSKENGSFYLNGKNSPLCRRANANLSWDESKRENYNSTYKKGIFKIDEERERCQPYIIKFEDYKGIKGNYIVSDELYFKVGKYPYPLPSNSMQDMGFCILTPGEVEIAIELLSSSKNKFDTEDVEDISIKEPLTLFSPYYGIVSLKDENVINESHLEFSLISNKELLANLVDLPEEYLLSRQVPISPFKPYQMDRADICVYDTGKPINEGTLPNIIIELKKDKANKYALYQVERYLKWLDILIEDKEEFRNIKAYIIADGFTNNMEELLTKSNYMAQISLINYKL